MADLLIPDHLARALRYVDAITSGGISISAEQLDLFVTTPMPRAGRSGPLPLALSTRMFGPDTLIQEPEPVSSYLLKMGWISQSGGGVFLTRSGRLMLWDARTEMDAESEVSVEIIDPDSPFVYADVAGQFRDESNDLLVDRYVDLQALKWIHGHGGVKRILTTTGSAKTYLQDLSGNFANLDIEIRTLDPKKFHDRALTRSNGSLLVMGQSINGMGKQLSLMIRLSPSIATSYLARLEEMWKQGQQVQDPGETE